MRISNISAVRTLFLLPLFASIAWGQINPPVQTMSDKIGIVRDGFLWVLNAQGRGQMQDGIDHVTAYGGLPGDLPVTGNWNGSQCWAGCTSIGIYRSASQTFILDTNGDLMMGPGDQSIQLSIAQATDLPVTGDWNGNGKTKVGLFRPSTCEWFLDYDGNGVWNPAIDKHYQFGDCTQDVPVVGDWSNSGTTKIGVYRHGVWILDYNGTGICCGTTYNYGGYSDVPVTGTWYA